MKIVYVGPTPVKFFPFEGIKLVRNVAKDVPDGFAKRLLEEDPQRYKRATVEVSGGAERAQDMASPVTPARTPEE